MLRKLWNRFGRSAVTTTARSRVDYRTRLRLEPLEVRALLSINVWLDYGDGFEDRLDQLTSDAGVDEFIATEITKIKDDIETGLEAAYADFLVTFSPTVPEDDYETIRFDQTTETEGLLGQANGGVDNLNRSRTDTADVFTEEYWYFIESADTDAEQLDELIKAMTGSAAHELGHHLGLNHQYAYGDPSVGNANSSGINPNTNYEQNDHIMATGTTGLVEFEREATRNFSELSTAILEFADELTSSPVDTISEQGTPHGSTSAAQRIDLGVVPDLDIAEVRAVYLEQASLDSSSESDFYSFFARDGDLLTVATQSMGSRYTNKADTKITIYGPDENILYGPILILGDAETRGAFTSLNLSGWVISDDMIFVNLPLDEDGEYFIEITVDSFNSGDYDMIATLSGTRFAELDGATLTVTGTASADTIDLSFNGDDLEVKFGGTVMARVDKADVTSIVVNLLDGNDTLTVGDGMNKPITAYGGDGNDTIEGGAGNDTLVGGDGDDTYVFSGASDLGTDIIIETAADLDSDKLDFSAVTAGGISVNLTKIVDQTVRSGFLVLNLSSATGIENVTGTSSGDTVTGNSRNNTIRLGSGDDTAYGGTGNDWLYGESGNDYLFGQDGVDFAYGGTGNDTIRGGNGNDNLYGEAGSDTLYGGTGNDYIYGDADNDTIYAGSGADTAYGGTGNDFVFGEGGNDTIFGGTGNDSAYGGPGNDSVFGGDGDDNVIGNDGNDWLYGEDGADLIYGNDGDDMITGGEGNDSMNGGAGDDTFLFSGANNLGVDYINEGDTADTDTLDFSGFTAGGIVVDISKTTSQVLLAGYLTLTLSSATGIENVTGTSSGDNITGNTRNNTLWGGAGNDTIAGGDGDDTIYGEDGDDILWGNDGIDVLVGGPGCDTFDGDPECG